MNRIYCLLLILASFPFYAIAQLPAEMILSDISMKKIKHAGEFSECTLTFQNVKSGESLKLQKFSNLGPLPHVKMGVHCIMVGDTVAFSMERICLQEAINTSYSFESLAKFYQLNTEFSDAEGCGQFKLKKRRQRTRLDRLAPSNNGDTFAINGFLFKIKMIDIRSDTSIKQKRRCLDFI